MAATKWDSYPQSQLTMPRFSLLRHVHGPQPVNFVSNSLVNIHRSSMRHDTVRWMGFSCFCSTLLISDGGILHIYPDMLIAWRSKAMRPPLFLLVSHVARSPNHSFIDLRIHRKP